MADIRKIIFKPVITERSTRLKESDNKFVFELLLSERPGEWPRLRYVLGSMDGEGVGV